MFNNRNVVLTILFNFMDGACFSVWSAQLLPVLVNKHGGSTAVGWLMAVYGIAQLVGGLIAGSAADYLPREVVIRAGAFCGLVAAVATLVAVNLLAIPALYIVQGLWGIYSALVLTSLEALFADSVASGRRSLIYTIKWIVQTLCYIVGYTVALVMLLLLGNELSIRSIQIVMTVGLAMHPLAHIVLFFLRDKNALQHDVLSTESVDYEGEESDEKNDSIESRSVEQEKEVALASVSDAQLITESTPLSSEHSSLLQKSKSNGIHNDAISGSSGIPVVETNYSSRLQWLKEKIFCEESVPYALCFTDFLMAFGSGLSVSYLPLFFVNEYNITPVWLLGSYIIISSGTALCATVVRYVGEHCIGRLQAVICVRILGTSSMLLLALARGPLASFYVLLTFFIVRNATMNSVLGIIRSVMMDCVKKENRAKWSAFESIFAFTSAASATIGGYIVDAKGYQFVFLVTAIVQFIGVFSLIPVAITARGIEQRLLQKKA